MSHPIPIHRRRFAAHPIQRKYFFLALVPLLVNAFFVICLALLPLHALLPGAIGLEEHALLWDIRVWLALLLSMAVSGLLSYFVTNKFAGPLYRVEQILRKGKQGDLPSAVQIRRGDDLQEFVALLDGTFKTIAAALIAINGQHALAVKGLAAVQGRIPSHSDRDIVQGLREVDGHLKEVENILANFKLPSSLASPLQARA